MTEQDLNHENDNHQPPGNADAELIVLVVTIMLISIGITLLVIGLAYIKDVETLRSVPDAIWNFICGRPTADGPTLPLLLTLGTLSLLVGGGLFAWNKLRHPFRHER